MYHGDDAYMWEENRTKKYKGIDIIEFYQKEAIKRKNTIPKKTFYNRFLKIGDHIMISKPYEEKFEEKRYKISLYELLKNVYYEEAFGINISSKRKKEVYRNNISFENFTIGDIVLATSPGFHIQGAIRHAAIFDSRRYHGSVDDECLLTAEPNKGVIYESIRFYHENFGEAWGLYVPNTTLQQRIAVVDEIAKHIGERYYWSAHKNNSKVWYCSLIPWRGYYKITGIDIDYNDGYWVLPIDIFMSEYTEVFEYSRG